MATITGTLQKRSELGGKFKLYVISATAESASDDIVLTLADHGITTIQNLVGIIITGGQDAEFCSISASYSTLTITVVSLNGAGTASTAWGDTTYNITLLGD